MGLGSTAKKIQAVAERAEQLYEQIIELRQRIVKLEESVDATTDQVDQLEVATEKQTVLLRALAEEQGIDVDQVLADSAIEEAEDDAGDGAADARAAGAQSEAGAASEDGATSDGSATSDDGATVVDSSGEPVE